MSNRWFNAFVIVFWLAAMSWLVSQKVLPPMLAGDPPDYEASLPTAGAEEPPPRPVCWRLDWDGKPLGVAASLPVATPRGPELRSVMRFSKLPVRNMLGQLLGAMAPLVSRSLGDDDFSPSMTVATRLQFDNDHQFQGFRTVVHLDELPRFLTLHGNVTEAGKLKLLAMARYGPQIPGEPPPVVNYKHELDLPRDALVGDSLSPRSELKNLRVGQQWTIPNYRPFPPNSPVQILLARVEKSEYISHDGDLVPTLVVVYHDEAGSGVGGTRAPIGRTWVEPSGDIIRQEVMLSNLKFALERLPPGEALEAAGWLRDEKFETYFAE